jgi:SnoaL-like domain
MKSESTQSTADRLAIIETLSSYAWGYDSRDLGMLGDSFSKDASFTIHLAGSDGWGPYTGRDTIVDWLASVMKTQPTSGVTVSPTCASRN